MQRLFYTMLFTTAITTAIAAEAPVQKGDVKIGEAGMTIQDCLGILGGLNALDAGYRHILQEGKPTESAETVHFKLSTTVHDIMSHDMFVLGQIQQEGQAANRRAQIEITGDDPELFKPNTKKALIFDQRMSDYTARPCTVQLDHIREVDLDLKNNDIPSSIRSLLTKILDK